ncbi:MAG: hypothetical protein HOB79_14630 [Rhodospirillaceae bacterium]|jgi:hypothetical protein|nr:hypothetical protein [Rhodospirillaceae bacterium]MBT7486206.1 hypothetical protein [Rhodospirillales bacterium]MBT4702304.1 hypothetical protein [Rhodospirillaceae bacterium]MBT5033394.1 hypothetical protein [Rhodospirillaceae bacterium]MBT6218251.1 hypothetical protein [Rhodospirillaceae bacterium]
MRSFRRDPAMAETIKLARLNGWSWKAISSHIGLGRTKINEIMEAERYADEPERVLGELIHDMIAEAPEAFDKPHRFSVVVRGCTVAKISIEGDIKKSFGVEEAAT